MALSTKDRIKIGSVAVLSLFAVVSPAIAGDTVYRVDLNKTELLRLPAAAGSIIIGNPDIADVTVQSPETLFVVGRGFGETNLIILDRAGQTLLDADIQVTSVTPSHGVRIFNGKARESYSCAPYCQPSPILGDDGSFIGANSSQGPTAPSQGPVFTNAPQEPGFSSENNDFGESIDTVDF